MLKWNDGTVEDVIWKVRKARIVRNVRKGRTLKVSTDQISY